MDLLNSEWHDPTGTGRQEDRLDDPAWLQTFLDRHGFATVPTRDRGRLRLALGGLRDRIRVLVLGLIRGRDPRPADLEGFNTLLGAATTALSLTWTEAGFRLVEHPPADPVAAAVAQLARSFARTLTQEETARIKVCANPDCHWVFYDQSRNTSRRWCEDPGSCGNLMKVRRFRERRRNP